jgi:hypothetical protein
MGVRLDENKGERSGGSTSWRLDSAQTDEWGESRR